MVEKKRSGRSRVRVADEPAVKKTGTKKPEPAKKSPHSGTEMHEPRMNVGARNPYIIAKIKLEQMGEDPSDYKKLEEMMEAAFEDLKYPMMFDPKYGSPVYCGLYYATIKNAEICPKVYSPFLKLLLKDPARKVGAVPCYCPSEKGRNPETRVGGRGLRYSTLLYKNNGLEFNDVVQGCLADCWLIAALSSVAWTETNTTLGVFPRKLKRSGTLSPTLTVYPIPIWDDCATITTSSAFFIDTRGTHPYYSHLNTTMDPDPTVDYECWMSYYEKCFASFYRQIEDGTGPIANGDGCPYKFLTNNNPTYNILDFKSPCKALKELTGFEATIKYTTDYFALGAAQLVTDLATVCSGALGNGKFIPTKRPVTAYTYLSQEFAKAANLGTGPNPVYDKPGIPANHAFSVLGLYQYSAAKKYVVLRNPWGYIDCTPDNPMTFNSDVQQYLAASLPYIASTRYITQYLNGYYGEAIFGLEISCFMRYFEAFCWVLLQ